MIKIYPSANATAKLTGYLGEFLPQLSTGSAPTSGVFLHDPVYILLRKTLVPLKVPTDVRLMLNCWATQPFYAGPKSSFAEFNGNKPSWRAFSNRGDISRYSNRVAAGIQTLARVLALRSERFADFAPRNESEVSHATVNGVLGPIANEHVPLYPSTFTWTEKSTDTSLVSSLIREWKYTIYQYRRLRAPAPGIGGVPYFEATTTWSNSSIIATTDTVLEDMKAACVSGSGLYSHGSDGLYRLATHVTSFNYEVSPHLMINNEAFTRYRIWYSGYHWRYRTSNCTITYRHEFEQELVLDIRHPLPKMGTYSNSEYNLVMDLTTFARFSANPKITRSYSRNSSCVESDLPKPAMSYTTTMQLPLYGYTSFSGTVLADTFDVSNWSNFKNAVVWENPRYFMSAGHFKSVYDYIQWTVAKAMPDFRRGASYCFAQAFDDALTTSKTNWIEAAGDLSDVARLFDVKDITDKNAVNALISTGVSSYLNHLFVLRPNAQSAVDMNGLITRTLKRLSTLGLFEFRGKLVTQFEPRDFYARTGRWPFYPETATLTIRSKSVMSMPKDLIVQMLLGCKAAGFLPSFSAMWDTVPLSFAIDEFTSSGDELGVADNIGLSFLGFHHYTVYTYTVEYPVPDFALSEIGLHNAGSGEDPFTVTYFNREVSRYIPTRNFDPNGVIDFTPPTFSNHWGMLAALLWARLS